MRRLMLVATLTGAAALDAQQSQQPVFRSALDVVTVDVLVTSGGKPVAGLTAKDFVLLDNGVRQTIESVEMEEVGIDVSLLVDPNEDLTMGVGSFHEIARRIAARLRPIDRMRVTSINERVFDLVPARAPDRLPQLTRFTPHGLSAANDGIAAALMRPSPQDRRHLVIAVTNGIDAVSAVGAASVLEVARRSQAVLHIVQVDMAVEDASMPPFRYSSGRERLQAGRCRISGVCQPSRLVWRPYDDSHGELDLLREAADATGGAIHRPGLFTDAAAVFEDLFADYRRRYLLRYSPQGVTREGWHEIAVAIPAYPGYSVKARRGYAIDTSKPPSEPAAAKPARPRSIDALIETYSRADYAGFDRELERVSGFAATFADLKAVGNPWPANPPREAVFVLELAEAALHSPRETEREAARDLLLDYRKLVRHPLGPDTFERYWLWTLVASLEGANEPEMSQTFVDYALSRFPEEPRFVLAKALTLDQARAFDDSDGRRGAAQGSHVRAVTAAYDAAIALPESAAEAGVRKAFFLHRIGRHADALRTLDAVSAGEADRDPLIGYHRRLFRGRILEALGRPADAGAAYRSALDAQPSAQSPRVALMRLAVGAGDRAAAESMAGAIQTLPGGAFDPWWVYWLGDYRQYGAIIGRLREQTK